MTYTASPGIRRSDPDVRCLVDRGADHAPAIGLHFPRCHQDAGRLSPSPTRLAVRQPQKNIADGTVKKVDPLLKTISVGWLLGVFTTTLEVNKESDIAVDGMAVSLTDIREGDAASSSCEPQSGKNITKSIEVTESEAQREAVASRSLHNSSRAPSLNSPWGASAPPTSFLKSP